MAKDPAFLFYPNDYIGGTMGMTFEEKGAYMELLMMQFNRGHMTTHMIGQTVGQLWDTIQVKFTQDDDGLWYNARLEEEKKKRQNFTESRRNNVSGTNQHTKKGKKKTGHMTTHMDGHMENENENENTYEKEYKKLKTELVIYDKYDELFLLWFKYKSEKRQTYKPTGMKTFLKKYKDWSVGLLKDSINHSIENNYTGLFPPNSSSTGESGWDVKKEDQSDFSAYETN